MCEPNHSIVQYPEDRGDSGPTMPFLEPSIGRRVLEIGRRIWKWLHFSKLGSGHSESVRSLGSFFSNNLTPEETRYEARWWDRTIKLDGSYNGEAYDKELASAAALEYAKAVSIGSLTALRNFLEVSLRKSIRPFGYLDYFLDDFLNAKGRDLAVSKLTRLLGRNYREKLGYRRSILSTLDIKSGEQAGPVEIAIKVMLGFTRKRELLNAAWADDSLLWVSRSNSPPGQEGIEGLPLATRLI